MGNCCEAETDDERRSGRSGYRDETCHDDYEQKRPPRPPCLPPVKHPSHETAAKSRASPCNRYEELRPPGSYDKDDQSSPGQRTGKDFHSACSHLSPKDRKPCDSCLPQEGSRPHPDSEHTIAYDHFSELEERRSLRSGKIISQKIKPTQCNVGEQLVFIKFYEDGCDHCQESLRLYERLIPRYPNVVFLDANVRNNQEASAQLKIKESDLPIFIAFKDHREVGRISGTDERQLQRLIKKYE